MLIAIAVIAIYVGLDGMRREQHNAGHFVTPHLASTVKMTVECIYTFANGLWSSLIANVHTI